VGTLERMRRVVLGWVVGVLSGLLLAGVFALGWGLCEDSTAPGVVDQECEPEVDGAGWCVQHRRRDGLFVEVDEVWFARMHDGTPEPRVTVTGWPFRDDDPVDATFGTEGITLRGPDGATVAYPPAFYALD